MKKTMSCKLIPKSYCVLLKEVHSSIEGGKTYIKVKLWPSGLLDYQKSPEDKERHFSSSDLTEVTLQNSVTAVTVSVCAFILLLQTLKLDVGYKICCFEQGMKMDLKQQLVAAMSVCFHCYFVYLSEILSV